MRRRDFLQSAVLLSALSTAERAAASPEFDYAALKGRARALARAPYRQPQKLAPRFLRDLTYDQYQAIGFRHDHALWAQTRAPFAWNFFTWAAASRSRCACMRSRAARRARFAIAPSCSTSTAAASIRASCPRTSHSPAFAFTPSTNWERTSPRFSAPVTSAPSAATHDSSACRRAGWRSTPRWTREEFPRFTAFWLRAAGAGCAHARVLWLARFAERRPARIASR